MEGIIAIIVAIIAARDGRTGYSTAPTVIYSRCEICGTRTIVNCVFLRFD